MKLYPLAEELKKNEEKIKVKQRLVARILKTSFAVPYYKILGSKYYEDLEYHHYPMTPLAVSLSGGMDMQLHFPPAMDSQWTLETESIYDDPLPIKVKFIAEHYFDIYLDEVFTNDNDLIVNEKKMVGYAKKWGCYIQTKDGKIYGKENLF